MSELLAFFLGVSLVHLFLDNFYNTLSVIQHLQHKEKETAFFFLALTTNEQLTHKQRSGANLRGAGGGVGGKGAAPPTFFLVFLKGFF